MSAPLAISIFSIALASVSFAVNYRIARQSAVRARKPVLVFVDAPSQGCWVLRNVGNGPALNVLVAQRAAGQWFNPVIVPPFAKDGEFPLSWLGRTNVTGLGATYSDFEDRRYTSTLGGERSHTYEGNRLPAWTDDEPKRYWQLGMPETVGPSWGAHRSDFTA